MPSYLGEINLYTGANYSVQIVQNKLKNKNNMKVEHYYEERNQFYSKGIIWNIFEILWPDWSSIINALETSFMYQMQIRNWIGGSKRKWKRRCSWFWS